MQTQYHWSARELANNGYVVLALDVQGQGKSETFKPSGNSAPVGQAMCNWTQVPTPENPYICPGVPWQQVDNYIDAVVSGINFMTSTSNPWLSSVDTTRIGAAGHSMGARAVSYAQGIDNRIDAIVAWDNLASTTEGDNGSSSGGPPVGTLLGGEIPGTARIATPRVPAMGQASEYGSALRAGPPIVVDEPRIDANPEWKKTAYQTWRRAGVESMELAFNDSVHGSWAQGPWSAAQPGWGPMARNFQYYTRAWFDRWLKGDTAATSRLLATTINGSSRSDVLSDVYYSAAYFDGNDCADLSAC